MRMGIFFSAKRWLALLAFVVLICWALGVNSQELVADRVYLRTGPNSGAEVNDPRCDQQYYIHLDWRNTGSVTANNFRLELRLNGGIQFFNDSQDAGPNTSHTTWTTTPVIWPSIAADNFITGVLDVSSIISESNEGNNTSRREYPRNCPDPRASIFSAVWSNEVDPDGDGYVSSTRLDWNPDVLGSGSLNVFEDISWKRQGEGPNWNIYRTTQTHTITGTGTGDTQHLTIPSDPSFSHNLYDWRIRIFRVGVTLPDDVRADGNDDDLRDYEMELASEDGQQLPDLIVSSLSAPSSANAGNNVVVANSVYNQGSASAGSFRVGIYLSTDNVIQTSDVFLGSRTIGSLAAGGTSSSSTTVTIPSNTAGGVYYIGVYADDLVQVQEVAGNNNTASQAITISPVEQLPDLIVSSLSAPSSVNAGNNVVVANSVYNQGSASAGSFRVGIYLSTDNVIQTSDMLLDSRTVGSLAVGGTSTSSTTVTIPGNTAAGSYYIGVYADDLGQVQEVAGNNNTSFRAISIGQQLPDLVVSSLSAPSSANAGDNVVVSNSVYNQGSAGAGTFRVGIYLSTDNVIQTSDVFLGSRTVGSLATGGTSSSSTTVTIPNNTVGGSYYIGVYADDQEQVHEVAGNNNTASQAITIFPIQQLPDLVVSSLSAPSSANAGDNIVVSNSVYNQGSASAGSFRVGIYLSTNNVIQTSDVFLGSRTIGSLAAGGTSSSSTTVTIPSNTAGGVYYIGVYADDLVQVQEVAGNNNTASRAITVGQQLCQVVARGDCPANVSPGSQFQVSIFVNMANCQATNNLLGSFTGKLTWNPSFVRYVSNSGLQAGFTGIVNSTNTVSGMLEFNGANPSGAGGDVNVLKVTFEVVGAAGANGILDLSFSAMSASGTFADLLPGLVTNDCNYTITAGCNVCGDVNDDGVANSTDALIILSFDVGTPIPPNFRDLITRGCGDVNRDGVTNSTDALIILSFDAGIPVPFNVGKPGGCQ